MVNEYVCVKTCTSGRVCVYYLSLALGTAGAASRLSHTQHAVTCHIHTYKHTHMHKLTYPLPTLHI